MTAYENIININQIKALIFVDRFSKSSNLIVSALDRSGIWYNIYKHNQTYMKSHCYLEKINFNIKEVTEKSRAIFPKQDTKIIGIIKRYFYNKTENYKCKFL